jgi:hypothetical protein
MAKKKPAKAKKKIAPKKPVKKLSSAGGKKKGPIEDGKKINPP